MVSGIITMFLCGTAEAQPQGRVLARFRAGVGAMVAEGSSPRCGDRDIFRTGELADAAAEESEPIPLTGTEWGGYPLTGTGRLY